MAEDVAPCNGLLVIFWKSLVSFFGDSFVFFFFWGFWKAKEAKSGAGADRQGRSHSGLAQQYTTSQGTTDLVVFSSPMGVLHTLSWSFAHY